ncbi:MAG: winged helix-turn-helix domain-containing protein [Candidatus Bathyarchaeota archaeon]|nr:winged helix-turn-helix domain-containing protein [Candidatus Bathyarchaeota archaeon]
MSDDNSSDVSEIESQLKGKTLQIYWYLMRDPNCSVGVREVQRSLGLSSPSVAAHHLDKLLSLGLVQKTPRGEYLLNQEVKVGLLKFFSRMGRFLVPRHLFYAIWLSTMFAIYLVVYNVILYQPTFSVHNIAAILFGVTANAFLWLETVRLWKEKPF